MSINWKKTGYGLGFVFIAAFMVWVNTINSPDNQEMVMYLVISMFTNFLIILAILGTGIGIEVIKNFNNKFKYKKGIYVQTLLFMKSGIIRKYFKKKDNETDTIKINDVTYATNPQLRFVYQGIPTYAHKESTPDPLNVWQDGMAGDLSCAELDNVMNSKGVFDLKMWLERNKSIILLASLVMVAAAVGSLVLAYFNYEMLRDGTFQVGKVVCSNIPQAPVITGGTL